VKSVLNRPLWLVLLLALFVGAALVGLAQPPNEAGNGKKADSDKTGDPIKGKDSKDKDKEPVRPKADKPKVPPGPIIVVPMPLDKTFSLWPAMAVMSLEEYQALREQIESLKKQLKGDKEPPHSCVMTGRLEGDYIAGRAEFTFKSEKPAVTLGLKGAVLSEKGELDGQPPVLDYTADDGFVVREFGPGLHSLVLQFRVPVSSKRTAAGGLERAFDLGLPQTVITTLTLDLPPAVKEIRWNDKLEKTRLQGKWALAFPERTKALTLSWREPALQPAGGPRLTAEGKIRVRLTDKDVELGAELVLEDSRGQTKECQLIFPPLTDVKLEAPAGVAHELVPPSAKNANYLLRFLEPNSERWVVKALLRQPRPTPGAKLGVGPFYVLGAEQQSGTITVITAGQRRQPLTYHLGGDVFQRDPPRDSDVDAVFQYLTMPNPLKPKTPGGSRVPLELEIQSGKGTLEASLDQTVKLQPSAEGWEVHLTAHLLLRGSAGGADHIDLQLPRARPIGASLLGVVPGAAFPATLPWGGLGLKRSLLPWAAPLSFQVSGDNGQTLEMIPVDASGRCRIMVPSGTGKSLTLAITGRYAIDTSAHRVRVELPRPAGITEQGSKLTVQSDDSVELLVGPMGFEEAVPKRHSYQLASADMPRFVDLAWRGYRPEFPVESLIDVFVRGRTAQVRQELAFGPPPRSTASQLAHAGQIQCDVPPEVRGLRAGTMPLQPDKGTVWITTEGDERRTVHLEYDLPIGNAAADGETTSVRLLDVQTVWPRAATYRGAKVRVWCDPGTRVRLAQGGVGVGEAWQDRGIEPVKDQNVLPSLVLRGDGTRLPLMLRLDENRLEDAPALVCDRALIQATAAEDQSLVCRARYFVSRVNAETVGVEFPAPLKECRPVIRQNGYTVSWEPGPTGNVARVPVKGLNGGQPAILDIEYKLPSFTQDSRWLGLATLYPPKFRETIEVLNTRWQYSLSTLSAVIAFPVSAGTTADTRWGLHGWLVFPEPSTSSTELETWLTGREGVDVPWLVTVSFAHNAEEPQRVLHQPRLRWVIFCSGMVVLMSLGAYFLKPSWAVLVCGGGLLVLALLGLGLALPAMFAAVLYGVQPGLLVILLMTGIVWLWQERFRRQIVFIPGFARIKGGSSLTRGSSGKRPRELSTIDAPASSGEHPAGNTVSKTST
jgi:hypothetical protein